MRRTFHESLSGKRDKATALAAFLHSCQTKAGRAVKISIGKGVRDSLVVHFVRMEPGSAEEDLIHAFAAGTGLYFGLPCRYDSGLSDNAVEVICEVPDAEAPTDTLFSASSLRVEGGARDEEAGRKGPGRDAGDLPAA